MSQLTEKHLELIDLLKMTPLQLWNKFNTDLVSIEKIIVPVEKVSEDPQSVIDTFGLFCSLKWKDSQRVEYIKSLIISKLRPIMTMEEQDAHGFKVEYKKKEVSAVVETANN